MIIVVFLQNQNEVEKKKAVMRKLFLSMFVGMMALAPMAQDGKFVLTGQVKGQGSMAFYALTDAWGGAISNDMVFVTDDKVDFSFDMEDVGWLMVFNGNRMQYMLPAVPGETVTIEGDIDNYTVDGTPLYRDYNEVLTVTRPLLEASWKYDFKQACQVETAGMSSEEVFDLYQSKRLENYRPVTDAVLSFIGDHPDHESCMMLLNWLNCAEDIERAGDIIAEQVLDGRMNPYYEASLERVRRRGVSNPLLNQPAPDFTLMEIDGKSLALSSLHGKWVLLDFWSSTCGPAVSQFRALKEIYAKYQDYLEIVGVDCEDDEEDWKSAVTVTHKLPWLNVTGDLAGPQSPVNLYDETATPAYFLITPSGKVAMKSGSVEDFREIFKILFE